MQLTGSGQDAHPATAIPLGVTSPAQAQLDSASDGSHVSALMRILESHWVMTLATLAPAGQAEPPAPYCTPLFYALDVAARRLVFASSPRSTHSLHLAASAPLPCPAAAAVYLESETVGELRGAQLRGLVHTCTDAAVLQPSLALYLARHPVARPMLEGGRHTLYAFELQWAKITDNRIGLGLHPEIRF